MTNIQHTSLLRYIFIFIATYVGITILLAIVDNLTSSTSINGIKFITPMLAGNFVNDSFLKRNKRLYTSNEKEKIIWGGLLSVLLIDIVLSGIAIFSGAYTDAVISSRALIYIAVGSLLFMLVLNYGLLMWVFGSLAEKQLKRIEKKHGSISDTFD